MFHLTDVFKHIIDGFYDGSFAEQYFINDSHHSIFHVLFDAIKVVITSESESFQGLFLVLLFDSSGN